MLRRFRLEEPQSVAEVSDLLGRFGDSAQGERTDRDAQLRTRDHQRDLVHRPQRRARPAGRHRHRLDHGAA